MRGLRTRFPRLANDDAQITTLLLLLLHTLHAGIKYNQGRYGGCQAITRSFSAAPLPYRAGHSLHADLKSTRVPFTLWNWPLYWPWKAGVRVLCRKREGMGRTYLCWFWLPGSELTFDSEMVRWRRS